MTRTRFSAAAILLTTALLPLLSACKKLPVGHPPAAPNEPVGISNGGYNSPYEFAATTADPDTDSVAIHFSWGDGASSEWSAWVASGETVAMSHSWASPGSYQVKAQAKDKPGLTSDWSTPHQVVVVSTRAPNAPGTPNGPTEGHRDTLYTFTTITTDPDGDGVCYRFSWGDGDTSGWSDWVSSGSAMALSHAYSRSGTFGARAQAKDANEVTSAWSNPHQIAIPNPNPPNAPSAPSGPRNAHTGQACSYSTWAEEPDGDSVAVRFDWGDSDTSGWSEVVPSNSTVTMDHSWRDTGSCRVRAQAKDVYGAASSWSDACWVLVGNEPPDTPETPSGPEEGSWDIAYSFSTSATDPEGDSVTVRFDWGDNDTSTWSQVVPSNSVVNMAHAWQDTGNYYVRAQARDVSGAVSSWSSRLTIKISRLRWRYRVSFFVLSSPAIGEDGTVYVPAADGSYPAGTLFAFSRDGALRWQYQYCNTGSASPAIGADGTIYVGSDNHYDYSLIALNQNGTMNWSYAGCCYLRSAPAIGLDGTIYVGSYEDYLYALNPDGTCKWRFRLARYVYSPSIGADGTIFVSSFDPDNDLGYLYALNPDSTLKWRLEAPGRDWGVGPAIAADGTIYVGSDDGFVYALNPDSTLKWRYRPGYPIRSTPAIAADGTVYIGSDDDYLYALNPDGTLKWRYKTGDDVRSSAAVAADGMVYVGSDDGYLYALNPNGDLEWRYQTNGKVSFSPAIGADGTVYVGSGCDIYAIRGSSPLADAPWPKYHHDNRNTGRVGGGR